MSEPINHEEAEHLAILKQGESNLARCYLDGRERIAGLEAMATEMVYAVPGGSIYDPQQISDALREIAAKHGVIVKDE